MVQDVLNHVYEDDDDDGQSLGSLKDVNINVNGGVVNPALISPSEDGWYCIYQMFSKILVYCTHDVRIHI